MNAHRLTQRTIRAALLLSTIAALAACSIETMPDLPPATASPPTSAVPTRALPVTRAPAATEPPPAEHRPVFERAPCPFDAPEGQRVECGFVIVPEDHGNPIGPTIRLAVALFLTWRSGKHPAES